jgi:predicted  nucleic acid-binding Zn-ribbon protein
MIATGGSGMAADALDVRIAHLEGAYEQIDKRLGAVEAAVQAVRGEIQLFRAEVRAEIQSVRTELHAMRTELLSRMDRQFFWILGPLIVSILLPIALRAAGR